MTAFRDVFALAAAQEAEDIEGFDLLLSELTGEEARAALAGSLVYARMGMRHIYGTDDLCDVLRGHLRTLAPAEDPDHSPPAP